MTRRRRRARARIVRLGIRVHADRAETALADLLPLLGAGAEERDLGGSVEYAIYLPEGELPPPEAIRGLAGDALLGTITEPVPEDWERRHLAAPAPDRGRAARHPPAVAGRRARRPRDRPGHDVRRRHPRVDAARAGAAARGDAGRRAVRLGRRAAACWRSRRRGSAATRSTAVELDPAALAVIEANAAANGVAVDGAHRRPAAATRRRGRRPSPPTSPRRCTASIGARLERTPERLIASGVLERYADGLAEVYGMREIARRTEGAWAAVMLA